MVERTVHRVRHIKDRIEKIRLILGELSFEDAAVHPAVWPAFERHLEVISEASRNIPDDWRTEFGPEIPWRQIAAIGNLLRHVYDRTDAQVLWSIYEHDLDQLEAAIDRMLAAHSSDDRS
jgi:uncharacterized protein with HEPN domain